MYSVIYFRVPFLAKVHITNVATDTYTLDWDTKTITITAYLETKAETCMIL